MRFFIAIAGAALAALACAPPASAQPACGGVDVVAHAKRWDPARYERLVAEAKRIPYGGARYYRIAKGRAAPSYLFGTAHVSDPRALAWIDELESTVRASRSVALENVDITPGRVAPAAALKFVAMMIAKPGELLSEHLQPDEVERLAEIVAPKLALSPAAAKRLRPWPMILALAYPECETERGKRTAVLDYAIAARASAAGVEAQSLETIDNMLASLTAPPMATQIDVLRSGLATYKMAEDVIETTIRLLDRGEVGMISAYARDETLRTLRDPKNYDVFMKALIDDRNAVMFRSARPLVDKGGAFIAVGALHLPGEKGLAKMFADAGYTVTPLTLKRTTSDD